ncbi:hypothetical protein [Treponema sp. R80B11-R83G3]
MGNGKAAYSADGITWTALSDITFYYIYSIAWGGTAGNQKFVAVGNSIFDRGKGQMAYWDGKEE